MLRELNIQNLAVIEATSIEFGPGLNVFTGQTGAGKSLILGAIQSLLGLKKSAAKMIRPGTEQARISGVFDIMDAESAEQVGLANVLAKLKQFEKDFGEAFAPAPLLEQAVAEGKSCRELGF